MREKSIIDRLTCLQKQNSVRVIFIIFYVGIPRWKPKLSAAGDEFCKAAILFYQMGEVEASKANLLRACECFKKKRAWYSAAKTLEQAMAITHKQVSTTGEKLVCTGKSMKNIMRVLQCEICMCVRYGLH